MHVGCEPAVGGFYGHVKIVAACDVTCDNSILNADDKICVFRHVAYVSILSGIRLDRWRSPTRGPFPNTDCIWKTGCSAHRAACRTGS